jgi:hypothetical protein
MDQKQQIADRLKEANNILVTVSNNPSVDQLASCIGLTLALNKLGKHATAVFSGSVPNTIEFLQPEKTIEKNTDSLRDFIIALDKSKADKLRYKVEDKVVKIFITPYRTSISEKDLDFSQGDFNVDVVIALGVHAQQDLDQAITSHGRILHDATVATINVKPGGELGTINWLNISSSSLSELVVDLLNTIDRNLMDSQMSTALLTGIVAETARFSNDKTSPNTMTVSAELMAAGANQQLVATKLEQVQPPAAVPAEAKSDEKKLTEEAKTDDGTLEIAHDGKPEPPAPAPEESRPADADQASTQQIHIDEQGSLRNIEEMPSKSDEKNDRGTTDPTEHMQSGRMILQPPALGGQLTGSSAPDEGSDTSSDPLSLPSPSDALGAGNMGMPATPFAPPSSAATTASPMPFMPASMTPGAAMPPVIPPPSPMPPQPVMPAASAFQDVTPPPLPTPFSPPAMPATPQPPVIPPTPTMPAAQPAFTPAPANQTLTQIEENVHSPHLAAPTFSPAPAPLTSFPEPLPAPTFTPPVPPMAPTPAPPPPVIPPAPAPMSEADTQSADLSNARQAVMQAIASQPTNMNLEPIQALNAQPLGEPLHDIQPSAPGPLPPPPPPLPGPNGLVTGTTSVIQPTHPNDVAAGGTPPPVPPPMMPQL